MRESLTSPAARKRVLFLSPRQAWPPTSGARLRDYHFARALAAAFDVSYLHFGSDEDHAGFRKELPALSIAAVPAPPKYTPAKVLRGLVSRMPLPVLNYTGPGMLSAIQSTLSQKRFDLVHLESVHLAGYLPTIRKFAPNALTVLNWHNIESELMRRFADTTRSFPKRAYARFTAHRLQKLERVLLSNCFGHLVCSERERAALLERIPGANIILMENGVETKRFQPPSEPMDGTRAGRIVFVGQMSYHANEEAAAWFIREIWPAVHTRFPALTLSIVGSDPTQAVRDLARGGEIEVTGTVPDVLPYYTQAFASIVPLQTGGGTRLKILEAMAAGTPVISTEAGAEGLEVTHGRDIQIAGKGAHSWIAALTALEQPESRRRQIAEARELVCRRYDWESIGARLVETYQGWLGECRTR